MPLSTIKCPPIGHWPTKSEMPDLTLCDLIICRTLLLLLLLALSCSDKWLSSFFLFISPLINEHYCTAQFNYQFQLCWEVSQSELPVEHKAFCLPIMMSLLMSFHVWPRREGYLDRPKKRRRERKRQISFSSLKWVKPRSWCDSRSQYKGKCVRMSGVDTTGHSLRPFSVPSPGY